MSDATDVKMAAAFNALPSLALAGRAAPCAPTTILAEATAEESGNTDCKLAVCRTGSDPSRRGSFRVLENRPKAFVLIDVKCRSRPNFLSVPRPVPLGGRDREIAGSGPGQERVARPTLKSI